LALALPDLVRLAVISPVVPLRMRITSQFTEGDGVEIVAEGAVLEELEAQDIDVTILAQSILTDHAILRKLEDLDLDCGVLRLESEPGTTGFEAFPNRPWGLLPVDIETADLLAAINALEAGFWVSAPRPKLGGESKNEDEFFRLRVEEPLFTLTHRELQIFDLLSKGKMNKEIAADLGIRVNTVKFHLASIYSKTGAGNRTEAVREGVKRGFVVL